MKEIGVGIIGYGFMGKAHTYGYVNMPLYYDNLPFQPRLIGVCNRTLSKAEDAKKRVGFTFATDDYRRILDCPDIQAVHICTPNADHMPMVLDAIQAGKHIYVDKPLAASAEEADIICRVVKRKGLIHQVAFHNRFFASSMRAKQICASGALGKIIAFRSMYLIASSLDESKPAGWRQNPAESGGGVLLDLGSHALDLLLWLTGEKADSILCSNSILYPERKDKQGNSVTITVEDHSVMMLRLSGGTVGTVEVSKICAGMDDMLRVEIHGTKGALILDLSDNDHVQFYDHTALGEPIGGMRGFTHIQTSQRYPQPGGTFPSAKQSIGWLRAHAHSVYSFMDSVNRNEPATPDMVEAAMVQHVMESAYFSHRENRWMTIE